MRAQTTRECVLLLQNLMQTWLALLAEQRLSSSSLDAAAAACSSNSSSAEQQQLPHLGRGDAVAASTGSLSASRDAAPGGGLAASASSLELDLHQLEGTLFMLLCSYSAAVRCDAYRVLALLCTLHKELASLAAEQGVRLSASQAAAVPGAPALGSLLLAVAGGGTGGSFSSTASAAAAAGLPDVSSGGVLAVAAGSASGGSGVFSRSSHKPSASRDSAELAQLLGACVRGACSLQRPAAGVREQQGQAACCRGGG